MSDQAGRTSIRPTLRLSWLGLLPLVMVLAATSPSARAGDLKNVIKDLYGGDGITLGEATMFNHSAHFTTQSLQGLDNLNQALVSGVRVPSFNSVVTGRAGPYHRQPRAAPCRVGSHAGGRPVQLRRQPHPCPLHALPGRQPFRPAPAIPASLRQHGRPTRARVITLCL